MKNFDDIPFADVVLQDAEQLPKLAGTMDGADLLGVDLKTSNHIICANRYIAALQIIKELLRQLPEVKP